MLSVEDMVNLLHESDVLTKSLEEQIVFYQVPVLVVCVFGGTKFCVHSYIWF